MCQPAACARVIASRKSSSEPQYREPVNSPSGPYGVVNAAVHLEYVRVTANQFVGHGPDRVGHRERPHLRGDLREEDALEDVIANFLT